MTRFKNGQRVQVVDDERGLKGECGQVVRLLMRDNSAWINMDRDLPMDLRSFPADDPHGRANHINLFPEECELATAVPA